MNNEMIYKCSKIYKICKKFIDDNKISCPEMTYDDKVYVNAPDLIEDLANIIGYYENPEHN